MLSAGIELSIAGRNWMPSDMTKHENIAKALKARLSELTNRVVEIESELRKPLSADLEEPATDLENQAALAAIENSEIHEIRRGAPLLNAPVLPTERIAQHCRAAGFQSGLCLLRVKPRHCSDVRPLHDRSTEGGSPSAVSLCRKHARGGHPG
jgi:hypothetical protein